MIDTMILSGMLHTFALFGVILTTGSVSVITRSRVGILGTVMFAGVFLF